MDFKQIFATALKVVSLDEATMKKVAKDKDGMRPSLIVIGLFSLISAFGFYFFPPIIIPGFAVYRPDIFTTILMIGTTFLMFTASFFIVGFIAEKFFSSALDMKSYVKVLGLGQIGGFLALLPTLALLTWVWSFVIFLFVSRKLAKLEWGSIILLVLFAAILIGLLKLTLELFGLPVLDYTYDKPFFFRLV